MKKDPPQHATREMEMKIKKFLTWFVGSGIFPSSGFVFVILVVPASEVTFFAESVDVVFPADSVVFAASIAYSLSMALISWVRRYSIFVSSHFAFSKTHIKVKKRPKIENKDFLSIFLFLFL